MKRIGAVIGGWLALIILPGCGRVINWQKNTFYQGEDVEQFVAIPQTYIRSLYLYDQLSTVCMFDALWLSDAVRTAYVTAHTNKTGKGPEFRSNFLRRQLEENNHFISFYILSITPNLDEKDALWSFTLCINDQIYTPAEIKAVDLSPEYIAFFGKKYNKFKIVYELKFNARTPEEKPLLDKNVHVLSLRVRSLYKQGMLSWQVPDQEKGIVS